MPKERSTDTTQPQGSDITPATAHAVAQEPTGTETKRRFISPFPAGTPYDNAFQFLAHETHTAITLGLLVHAERIENGLMKPGTAITDMRTHILPHIRKVVGDSFIRRREGQIMTYSVANAQEVGEIKSLEEIPQIFPGIENKLLPHSSHIGSADRRTLFEYIVDQKRKGIDPGSLQQAAEVYKGASPTTVRQLRTLKHNLIKELQDLVETEPQVYLSAPKPLAEPPNASANSGRRRLGNAETREKLPAREQEVKSPPPPDAIPSKKMRAQLLSASVAEAGNNIFMVVLENENQTVTQEPAVMGREAAEIIKAYFDLPAGTQIDRLRKELFKRLKMPEEKFVEFFNTARDAMIQAWGIFIDVRAEGDLMGRMTIKPQGIDPLPDPVTLQLIQKSRENPVYRDLSGTRFFEDLRPSYKDILNTLKESSIGSPIHLTQEQLERVDELNQDLKQKGIRIVHLTQGRIVTGSYLQ